MNEFKNAKLKRNAQSLRKNMTPQERKLWFEFLKELPVTVHRQKVAGNFILDFYIANSNIAIEIDGSQHYEIAGEASDKKRDDFLRENGITVLRYSNYDINNHFSCVCQDILNHINF